MQRKRCLIPLLFAIVVVYIGCGETGEDNGQEATVGDILAIGGVGDTLYLGCDEGLFRFNNKSQSWEQVDLYPVFDIVVDETTIYIGTLGGIYRVVPGGNTHAPITTLPKGMSGGVRALAVEGDTIYAVVRNSAILKDQLVGSKDRGKSWHKINVSGYVDEMAQNVHIAAHTVYAVVEKQGIYRSDDGGQKWSAINQGLPDISYRWPPLLVDKNTVYISTGQGVYRLPDGEATWKLTLQEDAGSLAALPTTIYAGTWPNGIFRSADGGQSWHPIGLDSIRVSTLAFLNNRLYAGTWDDGVYYTDDDGATWHPLNKGLNLPPSTE